MQYLNNLFSFLFLSLLLCLPIHAFVVPEGQPTSNQQHVKSPAQPSKDSIFPQWTWLRNTLIEKLVGPPPKVGKVASNKQSSIQRPASSQLPANLLAKYGRDVVLRFNLTTPAEEKALAEVADTLFLDIWEFTNNWADIRLREDDVHFAYLNLGMTC
jgi:extracellular matrix protein 14